MNTRFLQRTTRDFLKRGGQLSFAIFAAGISGLIFSVALATTSTQAAAAHGMGWFLCAAFSVPLSGFRIVVISQRRKQSRPFRIKGMAEAFYLLCGSLLLLFGVTSTTILLISDDLSSLLPAYLVFCAIGFPVTGLNALMGGYLVRAQMENTQLAVTFQAILLQLTAASALQFLPANPALLLSFVGMISLTTQIYISLRYCIALRITNHLRTLFQPTGSWRAGYAISGQALASGSDIIVLSSTFWLVLTALRATDPAAATYTSIGFTIVRTFIVPLKSFGVVAGRMLRSLDRTENLEATERSMFMAIVSICALLSLTLLGIAAWNAGLSPFSTSCFWTTSGPLILCAIAIQFLIEPCAAFRAAVMKVTMSPFQVLLALAGSLWGFVLPIVGGLWFTGRLTLEATWLTLLFGRLLFACLLQLQASNGLLAPRTLPDR